jgi:hypothetical protein
MNETNLHNIIENFRNQFELKKGFNPNLKYNEELFFEMLTQVEVTIPIKFSKDEIIEIKKNVDSTFQIYQPDGEILVDPYDHDRDWYSKIKEELNHFYWRRYRRHLLNKGWTTYVLDTLNYDLDTLMNYLGDPKSQEEYSRRGLVMGDVQSGKTSNYIGLATKAADAGYKVIILLTGVTEPLRRQTQIRVEEGFIGYDVENSRWVGVGKQDYKDAIIPKSITSRISDFKGDKGESTMLRLSNDDIPFIFITKKNVSTLKKIRESLKNINLRPPHKTIDHSLLIIDDEADNASVNTKKKEKDPSIINSEIRKLLNLFSKSNYVGFTATPFANVFIDPHSETEMLKEDLFPKDFIYSLKPPSNYFGLQKIFNDKKYNTVQRIQDFNDTFPLKHKKEWDGNTLFDSLIEAVNAFLIVNVIRDLNEGDRNNSHRSMLINVSKYIRVQEKFQMLIKNIFENLMNAIRHTQALKLEDALKNQYINDIYRTYIKHYVKEFSWEEIFVNLFKSNKNIQIYKVPFKDKKRKLDYDQHEENGLRVIVIGGLALSRGLTLEGLTISYLYRSTATFDVLLQMGRWFGYRDKPKNYEYLCKVWMLGNTINYYEEISRSIKDLKNDFKKLIYSGKSPDDFGIRVRNESDKLGITSRNKMRNTKKYIYTYDLYGRVYETPFIDANKNIIASNQKLFENLFANNEFEKEKNSWISKNIKINTVIDFLNEFQVHEANTVNYFEKDKLIKFITENYTGNFDLGIISGDGGLKKIGDQEFKLVERKFDVLENKVIRVQGSSRRLGGSRDPKIGLTEKQLQKVLSETGGKSNKDYLIQGRNPILMIYPLELKLDNNEVINNQIIQKYNNNNLVPIGIGLGFPRDSEKSSIEKIIYWINPSTKWQEIMYEKDNEEDE